MPSTHKNWKLANIPYFEMLTSFQQQTSASEACPCSTSASTVEKPSLVQIESLHAAVPETLNKRVPASRLLIYTLYLLPVCGGICWCWSALGGTLSTSLSQARNIYVTRTSCWNLAVFQTSAISQIISCSNVTVIQHTACTRRCGTVPHFMPSPVSPLNSRR